MATRADSPELFSLLDIIAKATVDGANNDPPTFTPTELWKAQKARLDQILAAIKRVDLTSVEAALAALKTEVDAVKEGVVPVDISSVEQALANVQTIVTATKAQLGKDLAP